MKRANGLYLGGFLAIVALGLGGAALLKGGFYIGKHEGDTLHLVQMVLRVAQGEWPHLGFHTPIGVLAIAPMALLIKAGLGIGMAMMASQVLVAGLLMPAIWYVAQSRFSGGWAYGFGAMVLVLILALVHGEADPTVSISMHYNRWAWAVAYLVIATALLTPVVGRANPWADGLILGVGAALLALIKVTYFVSFAPAVLVLLIGRRQWHVLGVAVGAGLAVGAVVTLAAGPGFWLAYIHDLQTVRASGFRANPGLPFGMVVGAPAYMAASLAAILSVVLLRQSGRAIEGLAMLLLAGGFFYVTYQNFANDPQWLGLLGLMLWQMSPPEGLRNGLGWDLRQATRLTALSALLMAAPSLLNLAYSPFRHLTVDVAAYKPLLPITGANQWANQDLQTLATRARKIIAQVALEAPDNAFGAYTDPAERDMTRVSFRGEALP
ncbi:MAG TPA: hypothetical protein ENK83_05650, partial [Aliiroseovarius sp.]|nr:hypothetical protein [Aliiroseovarius sp.]